MFNTLVLAAFLLTLVPDESAFAPRADTRGYTSSVRKVETTAKTSRLPKRNIVRTCPEHNLGADRLECQTDVAYEDGKVDVLLG